MIRLQGWRATWSAGLLILLVGAMANAGCQGARASSSEKDLATARDANSPTEEAPTDPREDLKSASFQVKTAVDAFAIISEKVSKANLKPSADSKQMYAELVERLGDVATGLLEISEELEKLKPEDQKQLHSLFDDLSDTQTDIQSLRDLAEFARDAKQNDLATAIDSNLDEANDSIETALDLLNDVFLEPSS